MFGFESKPCACYLGTEDLPELSELLFSYLENEGNDAHED